MTNKITQEEAYKRIKGYLKRSRSDTFVENYPLEKKAVYRIASGSSLEGNRSTLGYVEGRFIDAIEYAVRQPDFLGDWCSWSKPDNQNHGKVEEIEIRQLKTKNVLDDLIRDEEGR